VCNVQWLILYMVKPCSVWEVCGWIGECV
jgi:hypothetical protein